MPGRDDAVLPHLAGAIALAAVAAAEPGGWYPFGPAKWLSVSVLVAAAATWAAWRPVAVRLPRWAMLAGGALLAWMTMATIAGREPVSAWIGTAERRMGLLTWLLFGACALIGARLRGRGIDISLRWMGVACLWCGGYAAVERWWRQPIELAADTSRLGGPFGSAAYLGAALCLLLPLTVWVALDRCQPTAWRAIAGVGCLTGGAALLGSGARAAWVGLAVAVLAAAAVARPPRRVWMPVAAVAGVVFVVSGPLLDDVIERNAGAASRVDEWTVAVRVISERPLLGAGPEGYRTVVADGVDSHYERTYGRDVVPDRAHAAVLDVAATGGVPAAIAYVVLVAAVLLAGLRRIRTGGADAAIGVAVVAYLTQQQLFFPLAELDPLVWLLVGALVARPASRSAVSRRAVRLTAAGFGAALTVALIVTGALGVAADRAARRGVDHRSLADAERAVELRPDAVRYRLLVANLSVADGTLAGADRAIDATRQALRISPHDPTARLAAAQARSHRAELTDTLLDRRVALIAWSRLVADDPLCRACQFGRGRAAEQIGDIDLARRAWQTADRLSRPGDDRAEFALIRLDALNRLALGPGPVYGSVPGAEPGTELRSEQGTERQAVAGRCFVIRLTRVP